MNPCIKTGCEILVANEAGSVLHGDAFYFDGMLIAKISSHLGDIGSAHLRVMDGEFVYVNQLLITRMSNVQLIDASTRKMWERFYPELLNEVHK